MRAYRVRNAYIVNYVIILIWGIDFYIFIFVAPASGIARCRDSVFRPYVRACIRPSTRPSINILTSYNYCNYQILHVLYLRRLFSLAMVSFHGLDHLSQSIDFRGVDSALLVTIIKTYMHTHLKQSLTRLSFHDLRSPSTLSTLYHRESFLTYLKTCIICS